MTPTTAFNTLRSPPATARKHTTLGTNATIPPYYGPGTPFTTRRTGGTKLPVMEIVKSPSSSKVRPGPLSLVPVNDFVGPGVALYIYGAPKDELETIAGGAYSHGHQEVCVDLQCHAIDNHQTYLNIQGAARYQPVLLWSCEGVSAGVTTHVRIRLIDPESPVGHLRGVSFERAVYIEVQPAR